MTVKHSSNASIAALVLILLLRPFSSPAQTPSTSGMDEFYVNSVTPMGPDTYDVKLKNPRTGYVHSVTIIIDILSIAVGDLVQQINQGGRVSLRTVRRGTTPAPSPPTNSPPPTSRPPNPYECNLKDLAALVFARYGTGRPIGVVPLLDRPNTYLVLLSGTEFSIGQSTHIVDDVAAFQGNPALSSAFTRNILAALQSVAPPGSHIIFAGHSLGGMAAQVVATNRDFTAKYVADRVITFGSPQTTPGAGPAQYVRVEATGDPVPRLGPPQYQFHRAIQIAGAGLNPIDNHMVYKDSAELGGYDVAGRYVPDFAKPDAIDLTTRQTYTRECFQLDMSNFRDFASPY
jgi:pimeloyl-ACP methyl ester carboxylesterase